MRKTKIVATIGPSSQDEDTLKRMIDAGLNVVRLNTSHGSIEYHRNMIHLFKKIRKEKRVPLAILVDLEGPKMRTGDLKTEYVELKEGQELILTNEDILGDDKIIPLHYKNLPYEVSKGDKILMSDGLIELEVIESKDGRITTVVKNGGKITHRRGLNVPGIDIQLPPLTDKDKKFLNLALEEKVDYVAQSFVRKVSDVRLTKKIMEEYGYYIPIISKIETMQAMSQIEDIIEESDGIMVARGDLGVELPPEDVPIAQKKIISICNRKAKPVITATQMLESMINNPRPTRAETSDVANAILDGTDAIMLSGETTIGKYPVRVIEMMNRIAIYTESHFKELCNRNSKHFSYEFDTKSEAIGKAVSDIVKSMGIKTIVATTNSGSTARMIAKFRPDVTIIGATPKFSTYNELSLVWGVYPTIIPNTLTTDEMINITTGEMLYKGVCKPGENVLITAGIPWGVEGTTNMLMIHTLKID